jgi:hypothetical protein
LRLAADLQLAWPIQYRRDAAKQGSEKIPKNNGPGQEMTDPEFTLWQPHQQQR